MTKLLTAKLATELYGTPDGNPRGSWAKKNIVYCGGGGQGAGGEGGTRGGCGGEGAARDQGAEEERRWAVRSAPVHRREAARARDVAVSGANLTAHEGAADGAIASLAVNVDEQPRWRRLDRDPGLAPVAHVDRLRRRHAPILAILALLATTIACTRTVTVRVPARIPCLPSESPPVPTAPHGTEAHAEEYIRLLGWVAYVQAACDVAPEVDDEPVGHYR